MNKHMSWWFYGNTTDVKTKTYEGNAKGFIHEYSDSDIFCKVSSKGRI